MTHLTITEGAARVKRSRRTLERWIADGDLNVTEVRNQTGTVVRRYVTEKDLLACLRAKLVANPNRPSPPPR